MAFTQEVLPFSGRRWTVGEHIGSITGMVDLTSVAASAVGTALVLKMVRNKPDMVIGGLAVSGMLLAALARSRDPSLAMLKNVLTGVWAGLWTAVVT